MRPHRWQPTRLPRPWDSPGKNTGVGCHFLLQCMKVKSESEVAQSCPTLSDSMDCSLSGSSIHGIFQARVLEWGAITFWLLPIYYKRMCIRRYKLIGKERNRWDSKQRTFCLVECGALHMELFWFANMETLRGKKKQKAFLLFLMEVSLHSHDGLNYRPMSTDSTSSPSHLPGNQGVGLEAPTI